jgi:type IV pilus assembly protein PilO
MKKLNLSELKTELRSLNPKEIYAWPLWAISVIGVILFLVLSIAGTYFLVSDKYDEYDQAKLKEDSLKTEFADKTKQSINLNLYKRQLIDITQASDELLKQLPNKSEVEKLLIYINQAGLDRGLKFEYFKPSQEKMYEFYAELPIAIKVTGTYDALGNFASDISQLSRVVLLKDIALSTSKEGIISMEAMAKTFRYLDQEELDNQRAAKKKVLADKAKAEAKAAEDKK